MTSSSFTASIIVAALLTQKVRSQLSEIPAMRQPYNPQPPQFNNGPQSNNCSVSNLNVQALSSNISTLQLVIVMTRHGSRSPLTSYPNDPYPNTNTTFWPDGVGELTKFGKQQMYTTGTLLRKRYKGFLDEKYVPEENIVRTNRLNRDFNSAALLLAGLYPPKNYQIWNPSIPWQPIPIWIDEFDISDISHNCQRYRMDSIKMYFKKNEQKDKYQQLLSYLAANTGIKNINVNDITALWETLYLQEENGFELPAWSKNVFPEPLASVRAEFFPQQVAGTSVMARLAGGSLLKVINEDIKLKTEGKEPRLKLVVDAVRDLTLQAILSGLGIRTHCPIKTSAFIVFELHKIAGHYQVLFHFYRSSADPTPRVLNSPVCPNPCTLEKLADYVKSIAPVDLKAECNSL